MGCSKLARVPWLLTKSCPPSCWNILRGEIGFTAKIGPHLLSYTKCDVWWGPHVGLSRGQRLSDWRQHRGAPCLHDRSPGKTLDTKTPMSFLGWQYSIAGRLIAMLPSPPGEDSWRLASDLLDSAPCAFALLILICILSCLRICCKTWAAARHEELDILALVTAVIFKLGE